ncbi:MAG TPA: tRNA (cytidine(56)-2'-O)-methyltransferase [Thermoplasmata archaeon]|nr:tRNA (cytidine(56)-2'-O)-methyltransferase [Thermoplasmata archaeon]
MVTGSSGSPRSPSRRRPPPEVSVLRVGHRPGRDPRLTTHVALAARAFGARRMYLHPADDALAERIAAVGHRWGGDFAVVPVDDWKSVVRSFPGVVVHLTMYGLPLERCLPRLARHRRILLVVGGAKVPSELYQRAKYNVAVGHQPHSEVAAVAVTLERLLGLPRPLRAGKAPQWIIPSARGKRVGGGAR